MLIREIIPCGRPVDAELTLPGSKSYTNRALILAALAEGESVLEHVSLGDDSLRLIEILPLFGVGITLEGTTVTVDGMGKRLIPYHGTIGVGSAGTVMRFLLGLAALIPGTDVIIGGDERMNERPIGPLVDALRSIGVGIAYLGREGCPPVRVRGIRPTRRCHLALDGSVSSQFISSILMLAPLFPEGADISVENGLVSQTYVDMTMAMMEQFGLSVERKGYDFFHLPARSEGRPQRLVIEADASGASYFFALAAVTGGRMKVCNLGSESVQGDALFPLLLQRMGCDVAQTSHTTTVTGSPLLRPIDADMKGMPDTAQTLAAVAACAQGTSVISGLSTLRTKETDRLRALEVELKKLRISSRSDAHSICIEGGQPHGVVVETYRDHRMAMSFAILGSVVPSIFIIDPDVVRKSLPEFWELLGQTGVESVASDGISKERPTFERPDGVRAVHFAPTSVGQ